MKILEHDTKNKLPEKKKEIVLDAAKFVENQQTFLRHHFESHPSSNWKNVKVKQSKILFIYYII